ncbi:hypothetical protein MMC10_002280 [Thelotrema lepadinum]|nr:hypothetical protein [Thelotrema lepadinum]
MQPFLLLSLFAATAFAAAYGNIKVPSSAKIPADNNNLPAGVTPRMLPRNADLAKMPIVNIREEDSPLVGETGTCGAYGECNSQGWCCETTCSNGCGGECVIQCGIPC